MSNPACTQFKTVLRGFSLVEMLIVIAIIAILGSMVITAVSNASQDSIRRVAEQQQVALQQALTAWIASTAATSSLSEARSQYTSRLGGNTLLAAVETYLDPHSRDNFSLSGANVTSDMLERSGVVLAFTPWTNRAEYPQVNQVNLAE
jgi:prepilin-type N-terminal cleavage/methylation domain-containing protein